MSRARSRTLYRYRYHMALAVVLLLGLCFVGAGIAFASAFGQDATGLRLIGGGLVVLLFGVMFTGLA